MNKKNSLKLIAEIETRTIKAVGKSLDAMSERVLAYSKPDYEPYFDGFEMGTTLVKNMVSKTAVEEGSEPLPSELVKATVASDKGIQICKKVAGKICEELEDQVETLKEELSKEGRSDAYVEVYLSGYSMVSTLIKAFEGSMPEMLKEREKELG
mgnify:CR=1 FL=1|jgi:hypothetical protein